MSQPLLCLASILAIATTANAKPYQTCIAQKPAFAFKVPKKKTGFELIDFWNRQVWATTDWTKEEFENLDLPLSYALWRKNDPRTPLTSAGEFLRSPGCEIGEYSYRTAFDRTFLQVVRLQKPVNFSDKNAKLQGVKLEKYHRITYEAGIPIRLLVSPENETYIAVAKSATLTDAPSPLPQGWKYRDLSLSEDLVVELFGDITVLRTKSEVSYQGPIEISF
ncbi:MAG: hypothetical protein AAF198_06040 [Pseudomonadota bacterium]